MKALSILILLFISQFIFSQKSQEKLVRKSFEKYKSSILNDKGEDAVEYVDSKTINYYSDILEVVITADSLKIEALSILDKVMVLAIRHRTENEQIMSFDGKSLLIYAIEEGMVGKNSVANNSIGEVIINEEFAKGQFIANGQETALYFHFYKENKLWKIDLTSIFPASIVAFENMISQSGKAENEFLFEVLEMMTGERPSSEIWEPID